ncbi:MAG: PfkB family carbohydrate kinase [Thermoproteota archaeon]|nr:PfkB family carbohydrate kinase [Thermoproteota archaeon]
MIDKIRTTDDIVFESLGGPACYSGITSKRFGFDVALVTKVGRDFPRELYQILQNNNIVLDQNVLTDSPTTKFQISGQSDSRDLVLIDKCKSLTVDDIESVNADCWLASPVIDELSSSLLADIKQKRRKKKNFVMLDPQGYLRAVDYRGHVTLREKVELDLSGIDAIKVDDQEMAALTAGLQGLNGMQALQSSGVEFVIYSELGTVHLLHNKMHYWLTLQRIDALDSTGLGDILCASFLCAYLKERDPIWAICFGAGAVRAALETGNVGIAKIPFLTKIEEIASYLYNTIGFQRLS